MLFIVISTRQETPLDHVWLAYSIHLIGIRILYSLNAAAVDSSEWECKLNVNTRRIENSQKTVCSSQKMPILIGH